MKKKSFIKVKQLRLIGIAVLVVLAAILVPVLQKRCEPEAPAPEPRAETAYYIGAWENCLQAKELEERDGILRDNYFERRIGTIAWSEGERELDRIEIHVPYLLYENPSPAGEAELELLQRSNETRESIGRAVEALHLFADAKGKLNPQPELLFSQILDTMRGKKKTAWTWGGLYCTAEQHMDMLGNTTLAITAQRMAAWDSPEPTAG